MAKIYEVLARVRAKDQASHATKKVEGAFKRLTNTIKTSAVAQIAAIGGTFIALNKLVQGFKATIAASIESAEALAKAKAAMKAAGDYSAAALLDVQSFAKGLQSVGTISDESAIRMFALAKGFVGTNEAAKALVATAADFAQAADIAFTEAIRRLGRATKGSVEDIAKFDTRILKLTKDQLEAGEATRLLGEKYKGLDIAAASADAGLGKLGNIISDVATHMGDAIVKNEDFGKSIEGLTKFFEKNGQAIGDFIALVTVELAGALKPLIAYYVKLGEAIGVVVGWFDRLSSDDVATSNEALERTAKELGITVDELNTRLEANVAKRKAAIVATKDGTEASKKNKTAADDEAVAHDKVTTSLKAQADAYTAAVDAASVFGETTSTQLEGELFAIAQAILDQKRILGEASPEFKRYAEVGREQMELLRKRIESLKGGFGDLKEATKDTAGGLDDFGETVDNTSGRVDDLTRANRGLAESFETARIAANTVAAPTLSDQQPLITRGTIGGGVFTLVNRNIRQTSAGRIIIT